MVDVIITTELRTSHTKPTSGNSDNVRNTKSTDVRVISRNAPFDESVVSILYLLRLALIMTSHARIYPSPLQKSRVIDSKFKFEEATPIIRREYPSINTVHDILNAADATS